MKNATDYPSWLGLVRAEEIVRGKLNDSRRAARNELVPRERRWWAAVIRADRQALQAVRAALRLLER